MGTPQPSATGKELNVIDSQMGLSGPGTEIVPGSSSMPSPLRVATGPRTAEGKNRSKRNALKHGIFSSVTILQGESHSEFDALLEGLRDSLQPNGQLEELLVEKLSMLTWRHRRVIMAEAADIQDRVTYGDWNRKQNQEQDGERIARDSLDYQGGLIGKIENPRVLSRCIELLEELGRSVANRGFTEEDTVILTRLYGSEDEDHLNENLQDEYRNWAHTAEAPEDERAAQGYATPDQCKQNVRQSVRYEITRLRRHQKARARIDEDRAKLAVLRSALPDGSVLDRLLKYEASLERAFDRTLNQLERLQRARLGQPVLPALRVDINS